MMLIICILHGVSLVAPLYINEANNVQGVKGKRQTEDNQVPNTFSQPSNEGSKHFQYMNVPNENQYQFGHRQGNEQHFTERHETGQPQTGEFKTKVRWSDKNGDYGEHYWDFNHGIEDGGTDSAESQTVAEYVRPESPQKSAPIPPSLKYPDHLGSIKRRTRHSNDWELLSDGKGRALQTNAPHQKHGGNYRRDPSLVNDPKRKRANDERHHSNADDDFTIEESRVDDEEYGV